MGKGHNFTVLYYFSVAFLPSFLLFLNLYRKGILSINILSAFEAHIVLFLSLFTSLGLGFSRGVFTTVLPALPFFFVNNVSPYQTISQGLIEKLTGGGV